MARKCLYSSLPYRVAGVHNRATSRNSHYYRYWVCLLYFIDPLCLLESSWVHTCTEVDISCSQDISRRPTRNSLHLLYRPRANDLPLLRWLQHLLLAILHKHHSMIVILTPPSSPRPWPTWYQCAFLIIASFSIIVSCMSSVSNSTGHNTLPPLRCLD